MLTNMRAQTPRHEQHHLLLLSVFFFFFHSKSPPAKWHFRQNWQNKRADIKTASRRGAYFPHCLIHPHKEFPQCAPANMCCSVFLCVIELAITHSSVSHWGNEGQGPQRVSWHASLSLWNTQLLMHLNQIHTICLENTHASSSLPAYFGAYKDTCPLLFLGLCKCIP